MNDYLFFLKWLGDLSQPVLSPHHHVSLQTHRADTLLPAQGMNTHNDLTFHGVVSVTPETWVSFLEHVGIANKPLKHKAELKLEALLPVAFLCGHSTLESGTERWVLAQWDRCDQGLSNTLTMLLHKGLCSELFPCLEHANLALKSS